MRGEFKQPIPTLDLRKYCRDNKRVETTVYMRWGYHRFEWLKLGQFRLQDRKNDNYPGVWCLDAYFDGHTDFEHDSAYIISFEVIGVEFQHVWYGQTEITCFINPNLDDKFRVPPQDYVPDHNAEDCKHCKDGEAHKIVEYLPPNNPDLYEMVKGKALTIITGVPNEQTAD